MLKDIINTLKDCFTRYKNVRTFIYQSEDLFNAQNDYDAWQVYVDDVTRSALNITDSTFTFECDITVLSHVGEDDTILDVQDKAYSMAATVVEMLDRNPKYYGVLRVHDYSILTVSHVSDDDAAGVRLTLILDVPNPADLCDDKIWGEPYEPDEEPDLEITTITLPKRKLC